MATRPNGQAFLCQIEGALEKFDLVEIDFAGRSPTPSFADQCLGSFVKTRGLDAFKKRLKLLNVPDDARHLIKHVLISRADPSFIAKGDGSMVRVEKTKAATH